MGIDRDEALRKAEKLLRQGRLDGAIAEYERIVDTHPEDITTATSLAELYSRAKQSPQAVAQFMRIGDHWLEQKAHSKAAASYKKVLKLDPANEEALLQLVEACARQGQLVEAKTNLRSAIEKRRSRDDQEGADELVLRLSELDPSDFEARLAAAYIRIRSGRATSIDLRDLAQELDRRERHEEAEALLEEVVRLDPGAVDVRLRLARAALGRNELDRAQSYLPDAAESSDPAMLFTAGEVMFRAENLDQGRALFTRLIEISPDHVTDVEALGPELPTPTGYHALTDMLVDHACAAKDYGTGALRLQSFLSRVPRHVPALLRLVEVCVDGDLERALTEAQEELAEAYVEVGEPDQARVITEDLLLRFPRSATYRDQLRRVLITLGETDPDSIIEERLGLIQDEEVFTGSSSELDDPAVASQARPEEHVDFEAVEFEAVQESEVDLTAAIDQLSPPQADGPRGAATVESARPQESTPAAAAAKTGARGKGAKDTGPLPPGDHAARNFRIGQTYSTAGMVKEAAEAFERAARDPRYRFRSTQALGRLFRKHSMLKESVEWLDQACEAPAPSSDDHRCALYELADALEATGETTRALAVLLDLVAEQEDYRDARARIDRLSRVQA